MRTLKISRVRRAPRLRPQVAHLEDRVVLSTSGAMVQEHAQAVADHQAMRQQKLEMVHAEQLQRIQQNLSTVQGRGNMRAYNRMFSYWLGHGFSRSQLNGNNLSGTDASNFNFNYGTSGYGRYGSGIRRLAQPLQGVLSYHNDQLRTGNNPNETMLTPANVSSGDFGKLFSYPTDGMVYAQPLYVQGVQMGNQPGQHNNHSGQRNNQSGLHNIILVATENDTIYAFDANNPPAGPHRDGVLWQRSYTNPSMGIYPVPSQDINSPDIQPIVGITGTPVVDQNTGVMYFVTKEKVVAGPATRPRQGRANDLRPAAPRGGHRHRPGRAQQPDDDRA